MNTTIPFEEELNYWLVNEDLYMSRYTREWLARTPPDEAADVLVRIADAARPEPRTGWHMFLSGAAAVGFSTSDAIAGNNGPKARKAATRAALMLANMRDPRSIPPLVRIFDTNWFWQSKYQEFIEEALLQFLLAETDHSRLTPYEDELHQLAEKIWRSGSKRKDLSERLTELLITTLNYLHEFGSDSTNALMESIARLPVTKSNRLRVKGTASALLTSSQQ